MGLVFVNPDLYQAWDYRLLVSTADLFVLVCLELKSKADKLFGLVNFESE